MYKKIGEFFLCIVVLVVVFMLGHFTSIHYSLEGTYSAGNEPDKNNIYLAVGHEKFEMYSQERILASGRYENIVQDSDLNIYSLLSNESAKIGYIVQGKDHIILLNAEGQDLLLEKVSKAPIVFGSHHNS
ncbi:MAG: hypothetical protein UDB11_01160 [Peptococcaceae bacterium]|nr:hypothetical protein [Peptococcaceae bacterium]